MATIAHTTDNVADATKGQLSLIQRAWSRFNERRAERRAISETVRALEQLDERALRDLQINRADFQAIAHGVFRR